MHYTQMLMHWSARLVIEHRLAAALVDAQTLARMTPREIERVLDAQVELFEQLARKWAWVQVRTDPDP